MPLKVFNFFSKNTKNLILCTKETKKLMKKTFIVKENNKEQLIKN